MRHDSKLKRHTRICAKGMIGRCFPRISRWRRRVPGIKACGWGGLCAVRTYRRIHELCWWPFSYGFRLKRKAAEGASNSFEAAVRPPPSTPLRLHLFVQPDSPRGGDITLCRTRIQVAHYGSQSVIQSQNLFARHRSLSANALKATNCCFKFPGAIGCQRFIHLLKWWWRRGRCGADVRCRRRGLRMCHRLNRLINLGFGVGRILSAARK